MLHQGSFSNRVYLPLRFCFCSASSQRFSCFITAGGEGNVTVATPSHYLRPHGACTMRNRGDFLRGKNQSAAVNCALRGGPAWTTAWERSLLGLGRPIAKGF